MTRRRLPKHSDTIRPAYVVVVGQIEGHGTKSHLRELGRTHIFLSGSAGCLDDVTEIWWTEFSERGCEQESVGSVSFRLCLVRWWSCCAISSPFRQCRPTAALLSARERSVAVPPASRRMPQDGLRTAPP